MSIDFSIVLMARYLLRPSSRRRRTARWPLRLLASPLRVHCRLEVAVVLPKQLLELSLLLLGVGVGRLFVRATALGVGHSWSSSVGCVIRALPAAGRRETSAQVSTGQDSRSAMWRRSSTKSAYSASRRSSSARRIADGCTVAVASIPFGSVMISPR